MCRPSARKGTFVPPTLIEIGSLAELKREVFGPVLHVLRFKRERLDAVIDEINATRMASPSACTPASTRPSPMSPRRWMPAISM